MIHIKQGRGPSAMGVVSGIIAVVVGVVWTIGTIHLFKTEASDAPLLLKIFFPLVGVVFIIIGITSIVYNAFNAAAKERLSLIDITSSTEEPDLLNKLVHGKTAASPDPANSAPAMESPAGRIHATPPAADPPETRLRRLDDLHRQGLITSSEHLVQRQRILDSL